MGASRVQSTGKISWTGVSSNGSFGSLPAIGSSIIIPMSGASVSLDFSAVADNQGGSNVWQQAIQSAVPDATNRARAAVWYCANVVASSGTFTITVTHNAGQGQWAAVEWSSMVTSTMFDVATSNRQTTGAPTTTATATTAQADEVVAAAMAVRATQSSIAVDNAGYTQEYETLDFAADEPGEGDTGIESTISAKTVTWTISGSTSNGCASVIATFKVASGGAAAAAPVHYMTPGSGWPRRIDRVRVQ